MADNIEDNINEEELDIPVQSERTENAPQKEDPKKDKIFGNDYNQGSLELDYHKPLQVDLGFQDTYLNNYYNPTEYSDHKQLLEDIFAVIESSEWSYLIKKKKKVTKENLPMIYLFLKNNMKNSISSNIEIFTAISEVLDVPFKTLYDNIGAKFKEELLSELDSKLGIFKKKKIKKLF